MNQKALININTGGRLGNHLFNFAWMMEQSRLTGATAINPGFAAYKDFFEAPSRQRVAHWPISARIGAGTRLLLMMLNRRSLRLYHHFRITRNWRLDEAKPYVGWLPGIKRSLGYLAFDWLVDGRHSENKLGPTFMLEDGQPDLLSPRVADYIRSKRITVLDSAAILPVMPTGSVDALRDYFQPRLALKEETSAWLGDLRSTNDLVIGVAVRQGDFRTWGGGRNFVDPSLFQNILRSFATKHSGRRCVFALCSDEPIQAGLFPGIQAFSVPNGPDHTGPMRHLATLAQCDYIIGTAGSTFIQWASFLGGVPLYPVSSDTSGVAPEVEKIRVFGIA